MDEYISREAVFQVVHGIARGIATKDIEALKAKDMKTFYKIKGAKEILDSVDTDLCYIPVADVQSVDRWINVDEALPEIERRVLVYYPDWVNIDEEYQVAHLEETHDAGIQFVTYDGVRLPTVTHWRPLPEPPKENENG